MLLLGAAYTGIRRAMERDQGRPRPSPVPLWRLLLDEIALMARRVGRWKVWSVVAVVFAGVLAIEISFSTATPGPVLEGPTRVLIAAAFAVVAVCAWAVLHAVRSTRAERASASTTRGHDGGRPVDR